MPSLNQLRLLGKYAVFVGGEGYSLSIDINPNRKVAQADEIEKAIDVNQEILLEADAVFPFMIFPDSIKIDRNKVVIIHRDFFKIAQIINIQISEILAIEADVGPFFGSVAITTKQFSKPINKITMLSRSNVAKIQNLLLGFLAANKQMLDYSHLEKDELVKLLEKLGRGIE